MTSPTTNSSPIFREIIPSIQVIRRNILNLLGVFSIVYVPVYLLSLLLGHSGLTLMNLGSAASEYTMQSVIVYEIILFARELALIFTVLCFAFFSENTIDGNKVGFFQVLRHGKNKYWKALLTLLPIVFVKMLCSSIASLAMETPACLSMLFLSPILVLTIFEFLVIISVSHRNEPGWKTYRHCWNLSRNQWWGLVSGYITSVIFIVVLACPIYLPLILIFRAVFVSWPVLSVFMGDLLYLWVIIEMILLALNIERTKTIFPQGIPEKAPLAEQTPKIFE
jgi:hypothetical protein